MSLRRPVAIAKIQQRETKIGRLAPGSVKKWIESSREKTGNASDLQLLQKTFDRMK